MDMDMTTVIKLETLQSFFDVAYDKDLEFNHVNYKTWQ